MENKLPLVASNGYKSIDTLCGGGGITLAMHLAGFDVQAVLNHNENAIESHKVFFTKSLHFRANVRTQHANALGFADYFHMSPDCRDHSRAKGGRPLDPSVRGLAEEAPRYLLACDAKIATFENVPEFVDWLTGMGFRFWQIGVNSGLRAITPVELLTVQDCDVIFSRATPAPVIKAGRS